MTLVESGARNMQGGHKSSLLCLRNVIAVRKYIIVVKATSRSKVNRRNDVVPSPDVDQT